MVLSELRRQEPQGSGENKFAFSMFHFSSKHPQPSLTISREVVTSVILNALRKARPVIQGLLYPEVWFQNPRPA